MMELIQPVLFDYQQFDTETRASLKQRAERINERTQRMAQDVWENGREFYEAQQELAKNGYGCFVQWAENETGYKKSSVYRMINVYHQIDFPNLGKTSIAISALYLLAAPSTPDEARQEAIERAQNGEAITYSAAKEIVNNSRPSIFPDEHRPYVLYPDGHKEFTTFESIQNTKALLDEKGVSYFTCLVCQDIFDNQVWHCPVCDHHWPMTREECRNCYEGKRSVSEAEPESRPFNIFDSRHMVASDIYTPQGMDACQTPAYAVDPLIPYLPEGSNIWEPACGEGLLEDTLIDSGFHVVSGDILTGQNFFDYEPETWDILITNPPYSIQFQWLERCYQLGKPFALLLKVDVLGTKTAQELFDQFGIEVIFVSPRINYKMPIKGWNTGGAQFATAWFTWGLGIGKQMTFAKVTADNAEID